MEKWTAAMRASFDRELSARRVLLQVGPQCRLHHGGSAVEQHLPDGGKPQALCVCLPVSETNADDRRLQLGRWQHATTSPTTSSHDEHIVRIAVRCNGQEEPCFTLAP